MTVTLSFLKNAVFKESLSFKLFQCYINNIPTLRILWRGSETSQIFFLSQGRYYTLAVAFILPP